MKRILAIVGLLLVSGCAASASGDDGWDRSGPIEPNLSAPLRNVLLHEQTGDWLLEPKIIGGVDARAGDDPWQVALIFGRTPPRVRVAFCGGSIIAPQWVLTAAHCVDNGTPADAVDVLAGTVDAQRGGQRVGVDRIIVHRGWSNTTKVNDIALLHLDAPLDLGRPREARAIDLASQAEDGLIAEAEMSASRPRVTGWGAIVEGGGMVRRLQTVDLRLISRRHCTDRPSYPPRNGVDRITADMICAGWREGNRSGGRDSCQGDSGGPLTALANNDERVLIGIVSWGEHCARPSLYGVYTRVASYVDWVSTCMQGSASCEAA